MKSLRERQGGQQEQLRQTQQLRLCRQGGQGLSRSSVVAFVDVNTPHRHWWFASVLPTLLNRPQFPDVFPVEEFHLLGSRQLDELGVQDHRMATYLLAPPRLFLSLC